MGKSHFQAIYVNLIFHSSLFGHLLEVVEFPVADVAKDVCEKNRRREIDINHDFLLCCTFKFLCSEKLMCVINFLNTSRAV